MIELSPEIGELMKALHAAQGRLTGAPKDSTNPHFRNRYPSLEAVIDAIKPALNSAGVTFVQAPGALIDGSLEITTMLAHTSGQWLRSTLHVPLAKRDPQGVGSAISYGRRYALMATLGLPAVDDDGEAAADRRQPEEEADSSKLAKQKVRQALPRWASYETAKAEWIDMQPMIYHALSPVDYHDITEREVKPRLAYLKQLHEGKATA